MAILEQNKVSYLHSIDCPHTLKLDLKVDSYQPVHCTALDRVLPAYQDEGIIDRSLKRNKLTAYTTKTSNNPAQLISILEQIQEEDYNLINKEYSPGVCCIAAPIFDDYDMVAALPGFSLSAARISPEITDSI